MAITRNLVVMLKDDVAKPKEKMFIYRDDVGVEMVIELKDFDYSIDTVGNRNNIQKAYALFRTPTKKTYQYTNIKISNGKLVFTFSQDIVNVMQEIGEYELQFQLYDKEDNRLTIPSYNFYVKEPLTVVGEHVGTAVVDESVIVDRGEEQDYIFVITDGYIKTKWRTGDLITKERLNKVENALSVITDAVNSKVGISQLHNHGNKEILDTISANKISEWDNKSNFNGDYNSLTNKPTIPTKVSDLQNDRGYLTEHQDISGKVDKVDGHSLVSDAEISRLATLENYDDTEIRESINEIDTSLDNKINIIKDNLQQSLDNVKDNETLIIDSKFTGEQFILKDKHNITIIGSCDIIQNTTHEEIPSYDKPISDKPLFRVVNCENITIIGINFISKYECVDVKNSNNITFKQCELDGNNNNSKFNGFVCRDSNDITLDGCYIHHLGEMPTYDNSNKRNNYSLGNGVSAYKVNGFNVLNCKIVNNAQNGIYTFACYNVTNDNNIIDSNGMSGIQFAFALGDEKNYCVINNKIINNYSDGLDINNTTSNSIDINCCISSNYYDGNGWYNKDKTKGTQDGSGVATLVGVNNVYGKCNIVKDSYRHSLYISGCKDVDLEYKADKSPDGIGTCLYIGNCERITIVPTIKHYCSDDNAIAIDSTHGANYNILIKDGYVYSDTMVPIYTKGSNEQDNIKVENMNLITKTKTTTAYPELKFRGCNISSMESYGVNIGDGCVLLNCKIISYSNTGIYMSNNSKLINCEVYSPLKYGVIIQGKNNVIMDNCSVYGNNGGVRIDNSTKVLIEKCDIASSGVGLHSVGSSNFKATNSKFSSYGGANSIRCEAGTTVFLDNNIENGPSDYTTAKKYTVQWV